MSLAQARCALAECGRKFSYDPSTKAEEIEGSISQALILMNNPQINQKIRAQGTNLVARILKDNADDNDALRIVYLRSLGRRPTFYESADASLLEAYVLDFAGDLYGQEVRVRFEHHLRGEQKFDSVDALVAQIARDVAATRDALSG